MKDMRARELDRWTVAQSLSVTYTAVRVMINTVCNLFIKLNAFRIQAR